jgi:hypothetical protein
VDYKHDPEQQILERAEFVWKNLEQTSRLLKNTHMLRCRSIAALQRTVSTSPLVDFSRASHLDVFEQPARGFFQPPAREAELVDQVFDAAKSGMRGVLGIDSTLSALTEEKVRTLVIADGLAINSSVCTRCDYFSVQEFKICPLCSGDAEQRDVTDRAADRAILTGADPEVVTTSEARNRLLGEGGLGARC